MLGTGVVAAMVVAAPVGVPDAITSVDDTVVGGTVVAVLVACSVEVDSAVLDTGVVAATVVSAELAAVDFSTVVDIVVVAATVVCCEVDV